MNSVCRITVSIKLVVLLLSPIEELDCNLLEECEGEKVFLLLLVGGNSCFERFDLRSDLICGSVINDLVISDDLLLELIADSCGALTVLAANKTLKFLGNS